jgi:hypothetical protein
MKYTCLLCFLFRTLFGNPFLINFEKENLTTLDYQCIDKLLMEKDLTSAMITWHKETSHELDHISCFLNRINRGKNWNKFDFNDRPQRKKISVQKINQGSSNCVVSLCTFHKDYPKLLLQQIKSLKKSGFDGYHISFWGEFPNPTGKEIKYIAIPYVFKIFAIEYARKLGFNNILWADSAMHFQKNPKELFDFIEKNGGYFQFYRNEEAGFRKKYVTDISASAIEDLFGVKLFDGTILDNRFCWAAIFGLNLNHIAGSSFINHYNKATINGFPFTSGCADETVFTGILGIKDFQKLSNNCSNYELTNNVIYSPFCEMSSGNKDSILIWQPHRHP